MTLESVALLMVLVLIALTLSIVTFIFRYTVLSVLSGGGWMLCAICVASSTSMATGWYLMLFFIFCMVAMFSSVAFLRNKVKETPLQRDRMKEIDEALEYYRKMRRWY